MQYTPDIVSKWFIVHCVMQLILCTEYPVAHEYHCHMANQETGLCNIHIQYLFYCRFIETMLTWICIMEDAVSRSSVESSSTNDDYVVVNGEPKLKITGTCS